MKLLLLLKQQQLLKQWLLPQLHLLEGDDHPGMIKRKEMQVRKLKVIPPQRGMTKTDLVRRQHQGSNDQLKVNQMVDQPLLLQLHLK